MIELPEALVISRQITKEFKGKRIKACVRGNSPHKFAFYNREPEEYASILAGKTMGKATCNGPLILSPAEPDYVLVMGGGGERILLHRDESTLPRKYQLLLGFTDGTYLTVSVQGWGSALLLHESEVASHPYINLDKPSPVDDVFTPGYFEGLFREVPEGDPRSIKFFMISKPGVLGIGNGCLQDILFRAKLHPRRRVAEITEDERRALYRATRTILREMVRLGGRDSERDLYDRPGGYKRILHSKVVGQPCPECGTPIEKISFLGGASYFCPSCQVLPPGGVP